MLKGFNAGWIAALALLVLPARAGAVLTIEITQGVEGALPIAVVPFGIEGGATPPEDVSAIVSADLRRSGRFSPLPPDRQPAQPTEAAQMDFGPWRGAGIEDLVIGKVRPDPAGGYQVEFRLFDVFQGGQLVGRSYVASARRLRALAHQISDVIYEKLTGERGAFSTRIAYVIVTKGAGGQSRYELQVADADGYNPQSILISQEPVLSPAWSPDGRRLAYVSFENRYAHVFIQDVASGRRDRVAAYPGLNSAPAWSPDGRALALSLSKDGNPEIYILDLAARHLRRVTENLAIDTEPAWSPDGKSLVFTSDRGGNPQIYRVPVAGGAAERLTFQGDYNARASFSPDGQRLALLHGDRGSYRIAVLDLRDKSLHELTEDQLDESPSFAPNGSMIIYATQAGDRGVLAEVSVDGRMRQRLVAGDGDVREPAWGPFGAD
jgi:TolB protein